MMYPEVHSLPTNLALISSEIISIVAESGNRVFNVHKELLTAKSEQLRSVLASGWREASEKRIDLSEWDGDTVGRLLQFIYVDDYQVHEPSPDSEREQGPTRSYHGIGNYEPFDCICKELFRSEDINVFLVHVKVYVLAEYKDISQLQTLALDRLEELLKRLPICLLSRTLDTSSRERITGNLLEVLGYVFSNTCTLKNSDEPIRKLFLNFVSEYIRHLEIKDREDAWVFLSEGGDLTIELFKKVVERLVTVEQTLDEHAKSTPYASDTADEQFTIVEWN